MNVLRIFFVLIIVSFFLLTSCHNKSTTISTTTENSDEKPYIYDFSSATRKISLSFSKELYDAEGTVEITLDLSEINHGEITEPVGVMLVSPSTETTESVLLTKDGQASFKGEVKLTVNKGEDKSINDGVLFVKPGQAIQSHFYVPKNTPFDNLSEELVVATSIVRKLATSDNGLISVSGELNDVFDFSSLPINSGVLVSENYGHVILDSYRVIFYPTSENNFIDFLDYTNGNSLEAYSEDETISPTIYKEGAYYLIELKSFLDSYDITDLETLRSFLGEVNNLIVNDEKIIRLYAGVLGLRMKGFLASVNPALQSHTTPNVGSNEDQSSSRKMFPRNCIPNSSSDVEKRGKECLQSVPAVWAYNSITGNESSEIDVAIIDSGYKTTTDSRKLIPDVECDATGNIGGSNNIVCGEGLSQQPPAASTSGGGLVYHGNGVVSSLSARIDNNSGGSGVAGQVANPHLYQVNSYSYVFGLNKAIDKAVEKKASCINISAGYPCRLLTNIGPDFNICSVGGRSALCIAVGLTTSIATKIVATTVCAVGGFIPVFGTLACAAATTVAVTTTIVASATCVAQLALGKISGPLKSSVRRAYLKGVPIVVSAGNKGTGEQFPSTIKKIINFDNYNTDDWGVVPAIYEEVITVGAVAPQTFQNQHFVGNSVDVWAPIGSKYWAPSSVVDINSPHVLKSFAGTSDAAPYVTGVIANMMANNSKLIPKLLDFNFFFDGDPNTGPNNVERIRNILKESAFTQRDIGSFNANWQDSDVRLVVNPIGAVLAADPETVKNFEKSGYPVDFGFLNDNDRIIELVPEQSIYGTVVAIAEETEDLDRYKVNIPVYVEGGNNLYKITLKINKALKSRWPTITSSSANAFSKNTGNISTYIYYVLRTTENPNDNFHFDVSGNGVYQVELKSIETVEVGFDILAVPQQNYCASENTVVELHGEAFTSEGETLPTDLVNWNVTVKTENGFENVQIGDSFNSSNTVRVIMDTVGIYNFQINAGEFNESVEYQVHDCSNGVVYPVIALTYNEDNFLLGQVQALDNNCTSHSTNEAFYTDVSLQAITSHVLWDEINYDNYPDEVRYPTSSLARLKDVQLLYREIGEDEWQVEKIQPDAFRLPLKINLRLVPTNDKFFPRANTHCYKESFELKVRIKNIQGSTTESQVVKITPTSFK